MILTLDEYKQYLPLQTLQNYNATITGTHETRALYKWFVKYLGSELVEPYIKGEESIVINIRRKHLYFAQHNP